jgi:peptidoglycan/xylan/chitin deacetylase (PgdA/CDA1 family)
MQKIAATKSWYPVPILMYHAVFREVKSDFPLALQVTLKDLKRHLATLKRWGFTGVTFDQLIDAKQRNAPLPRRPAIITFDDGYEGLTESHAIFEAEQFPYTVFLVTDRIGKSNDWDKKKNIPSATLLSWKQIEELNASPLAEFQPHTQTHPSLTQISLLEAAREIEGSKAAFEDKLGKRAATFCYPYGHYNEDIVKIVGDAGFSCAVTVERGRVRQSDDLFRLPRISVQHRPFFAINKGFGSMEFLRRLIFSPDKR